MIAERCPKCNVPLHRGKERHYAPPNPAKGRPGILTVYRKHRCTATKPILVDLIPRADPLP